MVMIAKQSLTEKTVGPEGIFGDCKCFRKITGCPKLWYRQPRDVCPGETKVIEVPETYTDYEIVREEKIIWEEVRNQEVVDVPMRTYKDVILDPSPSYDKPVVGVVKQTEIRKAPIYKTTRRPIKTFITRRKPVQRVKIHFKKIVTEHINCCPNLKFWFIDLPVVVENNEVYDNSRDVVRK
ncbi:uncharacterized shell protein 2-like isoform X2 [Ostrea edulis]|uniref:uncharacterized shell protein 2-like isoform X2 n=1 Tax=Ostrea edulis TaxID=37623 RepID=UPI0024AEC6B3|nr:uncharacterized shell protein 2-like isoform X2 [Ostrea edulis]